MTDVELTRALERGEIANENFHHASHLHVAWVYLFESSCASEAADKMRRALRRFAASAGKLEKYHETITLFWINWLAQARASGGTQSLEQLVDVNPHLLEKNFPLEYYSRERLFGDEARKSWMEPDLKPLNATTIRSSHPPSDAPNRSLS